MSQAGIPGWVVDALLWAVLLIIVVGALASDRHGR